MDWFWTEFWTGLNVLSSSRSLVLATMTDWTTNWGQFVVAKYDTNSNNISSEESKNKTQEFFVNLAQRW